VPLAKACQLNYKKESSRRPGCDLSPPLLATAGRDKWYHWWSHYHNIKAAGAWLPVSTGPLIQPQTDMLWNEAPIITQ